MSFDVEVAHSVEEIGQADWDRLGSDRPFASYRWCRFGEAVLADDLPIYITLRRAGEPVARATFWLKRQESLPTSLRIARTMVGAVLRRRPLLACRSPLSGTTGLALPAGQLGEAALDAFVRVAQDLVREYHASFLLFDYLDPAQMGWAGWPKDYVRMPNTSPGTRLAISWGDFDGFLAQLNKKRRYNIRRDYRLVAESGIAIEAHPAVMDPDKAMELHRNVNARYSVPTAPWMRRAMTHTDMVDAVWLAAKKEGRLVGCELMLGDRGAWLVTGLGLDHDERHVYFVLGYEDIRYAIEHGAHTLRWGSETYDVKTRLGFEPEGFNNLVFASRWALLQSFGRWMAKRSLYGGEQQRPGGSFPDGTGHFP
jgi:predicted N-acyltransferase